MNKKINLEKFHFVEELSPNELETTSGGGTGFWEDVAYILSATAHFVVYAVKDGHNNPIRPSEYR